MGLTPEECSDLFLGIIAAGGGAAPLSADRMKLFRCIGGGILEVIDAFGMKESVMRDEHCLAELMVTLHACFYNPAYPPNESELRKLATCFEKATQSEASPSRATMGIAAKAAVTLAYGRNPGPLALFAIEAAADAARRCVREEGGAEVLAEQAYVDALAIFASTALPFYPPSDAD